MALEAQWARRHMAYAGADPLLIRRSGAIGHTRVEANVVKPKQRLYVN